MDNWPAHTVLTVRSRDCGADGSLDPVALLVYFGEGRRAYIGVLNADEDDFRYRIWDARLKINRKVGPDEEVIVRARCDELGESSFRLRYEVVDRNTGNIVADGASVQVLVDQTGADLVIPEIFRDRVMALEGQSFPRPS